MRPCFFVLARRLFLPHESSLRAPEAVALDQLGKGEQEGRRRRARTSDERDPRQQAVGPGQLNSRPEQAEEPWNLRVSMPSWLNVDRRWERDHFRQINAAQRRRGALSQTPAATPVDSSGLRRSLFPFLARVRRGGACS